MTDLQPINPVIGSRLRAGTKLGTFGSSQQAEELLKAVESAGFIHPADDPVDHLKEIEQLANDALTASPSGVAMIAQQILAHIATIRQDNKLTTGTS